MRFVPKNPGHVNQYMYLGYASYFFPRKLTTGYRETGKTKSLFLKITMVQKVLLRNHVEIFGRIHFWRSSIVPLSCGRY